MQGYILFLSPEGTLERRQSERPSRRALAGVLEASVPEGCVVLGLVLGRATSSPRRRIHAIA